MKSTRLITWVVCMACCYLPASLAMAQTNVALEKPVTLNGNFPNNVDISCGIGLEAAASTITDGVFLPESTCWALGSVYWSPFFSGNHSIDIDLQGTFVLTGSTVQVDNNDAYQLQYRDPDGGYHDWWLVPSVCCFGLTTRTNLSLPPVTATGLRIFGVDALSDLAYSVSEIQVFSNVPAPVAFASFAAVATFALGPQDDDDAFAVQATFTLGNDSTGIAPLTDSIHLQVGTLSLTIPAGSFRRAAHHGAFVFAGVLDGVQVRSTILPLKGKGKKSQTYQFKASGTGANLAGTEIPILVGLVVGDDGGSTTLTEVTAQSPQ